MSANIAAANPDTPAASAPVPKRITNAQTVCNERNEKNKLCNGHLKQLRTAGEASEVHLRGDDVLSKCHLCGTLYMGPPLGHVRDPEKQSRFVEAELSALLQAAGGTLPVIEKNEKGVFVIVEQGGGGHGHAAPTAKPAPAAAAPATVAAKPAPAAAPATAVVEKVPAVPAGAKPAAQPDRQMNRRTTYAGVVDTGPVSVAESHAPAAPAVTVVAAPAPENVAPPASSTAASPASSREPDRTLMRRSTYAGVVDTGPIPGETHAQKIERLTKLAAAAKQKSEAGST